MKPINLFIKFLLAITFLAIIAPNCFGQSGDKIFVDQNHEQYVKSVQLYPVSGVGGQEMRTPIVSLDQTTDLLLQFDLLQEEYSQLQAKIIHCDADWTRSVLNDIEFLSEYNGFDLRDFEYSVNTVQLYVNYWMTVPKVKRSGNYIIQVYQNNNENEVLLTRRFIVYENNVSISQTLRVSTSVRDRRSNQQIDFNMSYRQLRVSNPNSEFTIVLRQNQRWDNAIVDLKPTMVNRGNAMLEFRHFNGENNFAGGNEFRFIDLRTYSFRGRYIAKLDRTTKPIRAEVNMDYSRSMQAYSQFRDMNGSYFIATMEAGAGYFEADYMNVMFRFKSPATLEPVYLLGAFNHWVKDESSAMSYDPQSGTYFRNVLLKQGIYDYQYWIDGQDPLKFEGSFYETENKYEIIVYHKSFTDLTDRVVGYQVFSTQP